MYIVVDTHVIISGLKYSASYTSQIIQAWHEERITIAVSSPILQELRAVLDYAYVAQRYHLTNDEKDMLVADIRLRAHYISQPPEVHVCRDPNDDMWFACAVAANAQYIVSKDKEILAIGEYQGIQTVKPGYFVEQVLKERQIA